MGLFNKLSSPKHRESIVQMLLALGTFAAMPSPDESLPTLYLILVICEWVFTGAWAWSLVFQESLSRTLWFAAFILALVLLFKLNWYLHPMLLLLFPLWKQARELRIRQQAAKKIIPTIVLGIIFGLAPQVMAEDSISEEELKLMEAEMGDMSELTNPTPVKKKQKKKSKKQSDVKVESVSTESDSAKAPAAPVKTKSEVKAEPEVSSESDPLAAAESQQPPAPPQKETPAQSAAPAQAPSSPPPVESTTVEASVPAVASGGELPMSISENEKVEVPDITKQEVPKAATPEKAQGPKNSKAKVPHELEESEDPSKLSRREKREQMKLLPKPGVESAREREKNKDVTLTELPKYLTGYEVLDFSSCSVYDQIPWKFSPDKRKKRLLIKDKLRHQTETVFKTWEVHQVMDAEGFVSYVFRSAMSDGRYDSIVVKDTIYNRFLETPKGKKQIELQDLKSLVNRQALTFYTQDNSTIALMPSTIGKSALVIQQGRTDGRVLPPIFIRGNTCDRPDDDENADQKAKVDGAGEKGLPPVKK